MRRGIPDERAEPRGERSLAQLTAAQRIGEQSRRQRDRFEEPLLDGHGLQPTALVFERALPPTLETPPAIRLHEQAMPPSRGSCNHRLWGRVPTPR